VEEMPDLPRGLDGMRILLAGARGAFPDMQYVVEVVVAEGDTVALLYSWTGTHLGEIGGFPATGREVHATGAIFCRLAGDRIVEQWDLDDRLGTMQQLGVLTPPSQQA
jgi:predicted ester cyclase